MAMFYGRFKIRLFRETLRGYADNQDRRPIEPDHELSVMYREVFEAPDAYVNLNPLTEDGRGYMRLLVDASKRKPLTGAWKVAVEFANWLDAKYQNNEPI